MIWLQVPADPGEVCYESRLEATPDALQRWEQSVAGRGFKAAVNVSERLPVVSLGEPDLYNLKDILPNTGISPLLKAQFDQAEFYLVRLPCSFRPKYKDVAIEQATYTVVFQSNDRQRTPLAYDLCPLEVNDQKQASRKFVLSPSLRFMEFEASMGEFLFGLDYPILQPLIIGSGVGENYASWDYRQTKGHPLAGSKFMHVLLKVPRSLRFVQAKVSLSAKLSIFGSLLDSVLGLSDAADPYLCHTWNLIETV